MPLATDASQMTNTAPSKLDPTKLKLTGTHSRSEILFRLAMHGDRLLAGGSDSVIHEINIEEKPTEDIRQLSQHRGYVSGCVVHENTLITSAYDGKLAWWNLESGEPVEIKDAHQRWVRHVALSADGQFAASVSDDMQCHIWNVATRQKIKTLRGHDEKTPNNFPSMLYVAAFSLDGRLLATADKIGKIVVWEIETGEALATMMAEKMYTWDPRQRVHSIGGIRSLAFSPDGKSIAAGGIGQIGNIDHLDALARVDIFDWADGKQTTEFPGDTYKGLVEQLRYSPDGSWLMATGGENGGFIQFYDLAAGKILWQDKAPMHVHDAWIDHARGRIIAVGHQRIAVWESQEA
jgi:WD40 repeat protein